MKILIVGRDGRIAKKIIPLLKNHDIVSTTRRDKDDPNYLDLSTFRNSYLGRFGCVILCACDFMRGRSDEEQGLLWDVNVEGIKNVIESVDAEHIVFLSSYLSDKDTAYGRQKKAIEKFLVDTGERYTILNINRVLDYDNVAQKIAQTVESKRRGVFRI